MPSLSFNGTSDSIVFTSPVTALQNLPTGAYTVAAVMMRTTWTRAWDPIYDLKSTVGTTFDGKASAEWQSSSILTMQDSGNNRNWSHGLTGLSGVPLLVVISKAAGGVPFNASILNLNTSTWTHGVSSTNGANAAAITSSGGLKFGNQGSDWLLGKMAVFAAWPGVAMDQTQRMAVGTNKQTSDMWKHSVGAPVTMIEFDSPVVPTDWANGTGGANVAGSPTLDTTTNFNWVFDNKGAAATGRRAGQGRSGQGRSNLFVVGDTTAPGNINVTGVTATKMSRVTGKDAIDATFTADEAFVEYMIRKVSAAGDTRLMGTLVEQATVASRTSHTTTITDDELVAATGAEGTNLLKVFVKDAAGNWST